MGPLRCPKEPKLPEAAAPRKDEGPRAGGCGAAVEEEDGGCWGRYHRLSKWHIYMSNMVVIYSVFESFEDNAA